MGRTNAGGAIVPLLLVIPPWSDVQLTTATPHLESIMGISLIVTKGEAGCFDIAQAACVNCFLVSVNMSVSHL
ncbi:hypothetical protein N9V90_01650 [Endozoicomonas sp.]|nr:hypothetical protein [Endozoicomonas sp.]